MNLHRPAFTLSLLLSLLGAGTAGASPVEPLAAPAAAVAPIEEEDSNLLRARRISADLQTEVQRADADIDTARERLYSAERDLRPEDITQNLLEQSRLELASRRSRANSLKTRLLSRQEALRQNEEDIEQLRKLLADETLDTEQRARLEARLDEARAMQTALLEIIDALEALQDQSDLRSSLARQQLTLLQSRFQLPNLSAPERPPSGAQKRLQRDIDRLLASASKYRRQLAEIPDSSARDMARRRLLELQALDAEERAEFKQDELKLQRANQMLRTLETFSRTPSTPGRVLRQGRDNLRRLLEELAAEQELTERKRSDFQDQRQIIAQQGAIAEGDDSTLPARLKLLDELQAEAKSRSKAVAATLERANTSVEEYQRAISRSTRLELLERRELPADSDAWQRLGSGLLRLPKRVFEALFAATQQFWEALKAANNGQKLLIALVLAALLVGTFLARRLLGRWLQSAASDGGDAEAYVPLQVFQQNLWGILPPLALWLTAWMLELGGKPLLLLITPLLIWPGLRITLNLANRLIDPFTPALDPSRTHLLLREMRWVIVLTGLLAAVLVVADAVALSPLVVDAIQRLSMLCLLLIALPLLHLRRLIIAGRDGNGVAALRWISLLLAGTLVISAIIGLIGFVNLAWAIAEHVGWLMLVAVGWLFARAMLREVMRRADRRMAAKDVDTARFWHDSVFIPSYKLALLALAIGAGFLLFYLYDWDAQTPVISALPMLLDYTLFSVGETAIKFSNLAAAAAIVMLVFWAGSWSKEVSFRWAFMRIGDVGIRHSLSTFTQYLVVVFGLMVALRTIGLDLTALTVFAGALGVGIGFGMQQIVVNFISGILLLVERPLSTTDVVNVDKYEGEVTHIGIRALTIKTWDNQEVIIPNSAVITKPFTNWTRGDDVMRTLLMVGISYNDDPRKAIEIIRNIVREHPSTLATPAPKILLWDYAESALMIRVQMFTQMRGPVGRADYRSQLLLEIWDKFAEAGISIPFPQRDVHVHQIGAENPDRVGLEKSPDRS